MQKAASRVLSFPRIGKRPNNEYQIYGEWERGNFLQFSKSHIPHLPCPTTPTRNHGFKMRSITYFCYGRLVCRHIVSRGRNYRHLNATFSIRNLHFAYLEYFSQNSKPNSPPSYGLRTKKAIGKPKRCGTHIRTRFQFRFYQRRRWP